jgi:hypothetical protein
MENFEFDKFMQDIVKREDEHRAKIKHYADHHADSPARERDRLYREKTVNRIRYDGADNE